MMASDDKVPLTGMHGIAYRAGKDIFALYGIEPTEDQMKSLLDILVRMLREELQYVGNQKGWVQQYHAEQKKKGKRR